jgi:FAD/FMN-containing dehydrogenase
VARAIGGQVIGPLDQPDYDAARQTFNGLIDKHPAVIARPVDAAEVATLVALGRETGLGLGVRGGGHSVAGLAIVDGGLVIDLSSMRGVAIDATGRVAHVQGGAQWRDLDGPALAHGLAVPGGVYGDTGVGGLTLGGGIGFLMGVAGFSCDNLVGAQVVTAGGAIVEAADDPALLWALRGGGGNFGVVTRLDLALHPVGAMFGGKVDLPLGDGALLRRWGALMRVAPDPLLPMVYLYRDEAGVPMLQLQFAFVGPEGAGASCASELLGEDAARHPSLRACDYLAIQAINPIEAFGSRNYWSSNFVTDLDDGLVDLIVETSRSMPVGGSGILVEPVHGVARRYGPEHAAFSHRLARFHVTVVGIWADPGFDSEGIAWSQAASGQVRAWSTGGLYANYAMPDDPVEARAAERARAAYPPETFERLRAVKGRYDPDNLFRSNLNIPPT